MQTGRSPAPLSEPRESGSRVTGGACRGRRVREHRDEEANRFTPATALSVVAGVPAARASHVNEHGVIGAAHVRPVHRG